MRASVCTLCFLLAGCFFEQDPRGVCGDGELAFDEQCDDGNTMDGDFCSSVCRTPSPLCGNGQLDEGEECDPATRPSSTCRFDCTLYKAPSVRAEWSFMQYLGASDDCLPGQPAVTLHAQRLDENGAPLGEEIVKTTECSRGSDALELAEFGIHNVWISSSSEARSYVSLPVTVDLRMMVFASVYVDVYVDAGYPRITWSITDTQDAPLDCAQAGAAEVEILVYGAVSPDVADQIAPCTQGSLIPGAVPFGTYQVRAFLLSPTHAFLASVGPFDVTVSEPSAAHDASVTFKVTP